MISGKYILNVTRVEIPKTSVVSAEIQSEIKARLTIADFECSPEEITQILGIRPTKTWLRGEPVTSRIKNVYKENGWTLIWLIRYFGEAIDRPNH